MVNNKENYEECYSKLEAIEKATGEDMGFQKGVLDVKFNREVFPKNSDDPNYSSYDAGVDFAMKKNYNMFNNNDYDNIDHLNVSKIL